MKGVSVVTGWEHPKTAFYYEQFCSRHDRYAEANAVLVRESGLGPDVRILDVGAGTGRTAEAGLPSLGREGTIVCVEPSAAMRAEGEARLRDDRVVWLDACPMESAPFDRILCGASVWQMLPFAETFRLFARLLAPGGSLSFNIPGLYLGEEDPPGGGRDPLLLQLPALLFQPGRSAPESVPLPNADGLESELILAGLRPRRWTFCLRLTQDAYRDWLKIPVLTDFMLGAFDPDERAARIDEAFLHVDHGSWRWERWVGWTAKKPGESDDAIGC